MLYLNVLRGKLHDLSFRILWKLMLLRIGYVKFKISWVLLIGKFSVLEGLILWWNTVKGNESDKVSQNSCLALPHKIWFRLQAENILCHVLEFLIRSLMWIIKLHRLGFLLRKRLSNLQIIL